MKRYHCAVELAVDVLGGKWKPVILSHLKEGVHRYGELRRERLRPALQALYDWGIQRAADTGITFEPLPFH
ncbi:winged helix-turn-helix transcriptional regulator [Amycolatopsis orientalis]|uniref:winged helix-turn-helix transcriptional regulator n=1 Tax=Amycolatopsis orientalis TaxID=31958 RepID=UPI00055E742C|nr:winged helix-turn-helix transcriptional regulator [Amycolatopsis orientalis]